MLPLGEQDRLGRSRGQCLSSCGVGEAGIPAVEVRGELVVEDAGADLEEQVGSTRSPAHLLFLHHAFADDLVHGGLGCADLGVLAELAKGRMRSKIPDLTEALEAASPPTTGS